MMTCLSGRVTRRERNRLGSQSLYIVTLLPYSTTTAVAITDFALGGYGVSFRYNSDRITFSSDGHVQIFRC